MAGAERSKGRGLIQGCNLTTLVALSASHPTARPARDSRSGLTLVELLVVLAILAVLATVAVTSADALLSQGRYEATQRTLTNIEEAVLGPANARQPDGTILVSGFVADVGRVPVLRTDDAAGQLAELWDPSLWAGYPFGMRSGPETPTNYSDIKLPCGWRGPYLRLGVGASDARDGWGKAFRLIPSTAGSLLQSITWSPVAPYTDLLAVPPTATFAASAGGALVTVSGIVTNNGNPPASATVVLLYPDPSQSTLAVMPDGDSSVGVFEFSNVPIGLRAICAVIDSQPVTRYVYVPRTGLTLTINYTP